MKRDRKASITQGEFQQALETAKNNILRLVDKIPANLVYIVCFSSSFVLRACDPSAPFYHECLEFLQWRYETYGRITQDCDLIFAEDPDDNLASTFRRWNRRCTITVDWWPAEHYQGQWGWVKNHGLEQREIICGIPVQPFLDVFWTKKNLLKDPKHLEDAKQLSSF